MMFNRHTLRGQRESRCSRWVVPVCALVMLFGIPAMLGYLSFAMHLRKENIVQHQANVISADIQRECAENACSYDVLIKYWFLVEISDGMPKNITGIDVQNFYFLSSARTYANQKKVTIYYEQDNPVESGFSASLNLGGLIAGVVIFAICTAVAIIPIIMVACCIYDECRQVFIDCKDCRSKPIHEGPSCGRIDAKDYYYGAKPANKAPSCGVTGLPALNEREQIKSEEVESEYETESEYEYETDKTTDSQLEEGQSEYEYETDKTNDETSETDTSTDSETSVSLDSEIAAAENKDIADKMSVSDYIEMQDRKLKAHSK